MTKSELLKRIEDHKASLESLQAFMVDLGEEEVIQVPDAGDVLSHLHSAVDYLTVNLEQISNRVRMS